MVHIAMYAPGCSEYEMYVKNTLGVFTVAWKTQLLDASDDPNLEKFETLEGAIEGGVRRRYKGIVVYYHPYAAKIGLKMMRERLSTTHD